GLLYWPDSGRARALGPRPPARLLRDLRRRGVEPLKVGRVMVGTEKPHDRDVRAALAELGLGYRIFFNRRNVMAVPAGVDKASGVRAALAELGVAPAQAVGVGDG